MKYLFSLTMILILSVSLAAQSSPKKTFPIGAQCSSAMSELTDLHKRITKFFGEKNYGEASPLAKKMSEIAEANCVEEKDKRLMLATNVADIQIKLGKADEAREIYDKNLALAAEVLGEASPDFNNYLTFLIKLSINKVSNEKFEQYALKNVEIKKKVFGVESYEAVKELLKMAMFYHKWNKTEQAEPYYLEAIAISEKLLSDEKVQKLAAVNQYRAYLLAQYGEKEGAKRGDDFMKNRTQVYSTADGRRILNGMAVKLFQPRRSSQAFMVDAKGEVQVEITIGEDGKVIKAKAISGHPLLLPSSQQAAEESTFLPTYVDGKPVRVTGIIVYNFK